MAYSVGISVIFDKFKTTIQIITRKYLRYISFCYVIVYQDLIQINSSSILLALKLTQIVNAFTSGTYRGVSEPNAF